MVTTASQRSCTGRCNRSLETLLAPNTLCIAAKRAGPCSEQKYGAKMQSDAHFRRKNLHAPQGDPAPAAILEGKKEEEEVEEEEMK